MPLPSLLLQKSGPWRASLNGHQLSLANTNWPTASDGKEPVAVIAGNGAIDPAEVGGPLNRWLSGAPQ
jgi:hypothetical protein